MFWFAAALMVAGAYGSYKTSKAQSAAAREGKKIAKQNAKIQAAENAEAERRAARAQRKVEAEAAAKSYAVGLKGTSDNFEQVRASISSEHKRQMDWLQWSGEYKVDVIKRTGDYNYEIGMAQAKATMWQGYTQLAQAGMYLYTGLNKPAAPTTVTNTTPYNSALTNTPQFTPANVNTGFNPFYSNNGFTLGSRGFPQ